VACFESGDSERAYPVMTIDLPPIAAVEPPAVPTTPATGGNGASFGKFLDHAGAAAPSSAGEPASAAANSAAASSPTPKAAATAHAAAASGKDGAPPGTAIPPQPGQAAKSAASAALALASGIVGDKDIVRDQDGAPTGDQGDSGKDAQCAAASLAVPAPIIPLPVIAAIPSASPIVTTASAATTTAQPMQVARTMIANAAAASKGALTDLVSVVAASGQPATPSNPQSAELAKALSKLPAAAQGAPTNGISQTAPQLLPSATPSAQVAPALTVPTDPLRQPVPDAATTIAPAMPGASSTAPPPIAKPSNKASGEIVPAQAAALLGRVSVLKAGQSQPQAGAAPVSGGTAGSVIGATVTPAPAVPGGQADGTALVASSASAPTGAPAAAGAPLPPISGSIDLTPKFSATAIPAHGDLAPIGAPKAKFDPHPAVSVADATTGKTGAAGGGTQPEAVAVSAAAKAATDATLAASTSSKPLVAAQDDAANAHAANPPTLTPQLRPDAAGIAPGVPTSAPAPETQPNPIAALHSVTEQVAIAVKRGVKAGNDQIQINLEPASLGKISVRLDFAQDGRVSAVFSADRADTLNLLNGDARRLEQSLRDAGLRADSGSLTFNLSSGDTGSNPRQFSQASGYAATANALVESDPLVSLAAARATAGLGHDGSLDIHV
jgi:flagellar hook-length control protein FliK